MQIEKWLCFVVLWNSVAGQDVEDAPNPETQNYQFRYYVRDESTGDIKSQEEIKQGDTVSGHYTVGEPTGDLRIVTYTADSGGFRANVKYEEGGSPASEDKAKQTSAKSGTEFRWLPPLQSDGILEGKSSSEDIENNGNTSHNKEDSSETNSNNIETTTELKSTSVSVEDGGASASASDENSTEEENIKSGFDDSTESTTKTEPGAENGIASNTASPEAKTEHISSTEKVSSAEAAESAPISEEILPPNQMYLPVISYQNIPFLNLPIVGNRQDEKPPAIIYASQNFYNPWQWFGGNRKIHNPQDKYEEFYYECLPPELVHYMTIKNIYHK